MPEQQAEFRRIVGVLQRDKQILEIAPRWAVPEKIAVDQIDLIDSGDPQMIVQARKVDFGPLANAPPAIRAAWVDQTLAIAPCSDAKIVRLDDDASVGVERYPVFTEGWRCRRERDCRTEKRSHSHQKYRRQPFALPALPVFRALSIFT